MARPDVLLSDRDERARPVIVMLQWRAEQWLGQTRRYHPPATTDKPTVKASMEGRAMARPDAARLIWGG